MPEGLTVTGTESSSPRLYVEQKKVQTYFPQFELVGDSSGNVTGTTGILSTNAGNSYQIRVEIPSNYPYSMPRIMPVGWVASGPHIYPRSKSLCVMRATQWTPNMTLAFMIAKSALWLNKYDVYTSTDRWPGNQQGHTLGDELAEWIAGKLR